jgi:hypothetical protein
VRLETITIQKRREKAKQEKRNQTFIASNKENKFRLLQVCRRVIMALCVCVGLLRLQTKQAIELEKMKKIVLRENCVNSASYRSSRVHKVSSLFIGNISVCTQSALGSMH